MKILMLSVDYLPNIGGIAAHIYHLSKALEVLGHKIVIVNPVTDRSDGISVADEDGLRVIRIPYRKTGNKLMRRWLSNQAGLKGIRYALETEGPFDFIHQHDHLSSTVAARMMSSRIPWVWTNHTSDFLVDYRKPHKKFLVQWLYQPTSGIASVTKERHHVTQKLWPNKTPLIVIPNGVDTRIFSPDRVAAREKWGLSPESFVILCPSRMTPVKGVAYLAEAVPQVLEAHPEIPWQFVFVGSNPAPNTDVEYINAIRSRLEPFEKAGKVVYFGNVDMQAMADLYALSDLVAMPSLMEGASLTALEAMATRRALIATNVGGLPEIVHHEKTGLLVEQKDAKALCQAIIHLYQEPQLRKTVAEGGYQLATQHYSWQAVAQKTVSFYESCLQSR